MVAVAEERAQERWAAVEVYRRIAEAAPAPVADDAERGGGLRLGMGIVLMAWALAAAFAWALGVGWASWVMAACCAVGFALLGG